jgi:four helix bundle protein
LGGLSVSIRMEDKYARWGELTVWKRAHEVAIRIYLRTRCFSADDRKGLTSQLIRAALSVPTNIVEGKSRHSARDFRTFLRIARASAEEARYLILFGRDVNLLTESEHAEFDTELQAVSKMLSSLIASLSKHC